MTWPMWRAANARWRASLRQKSADTSGAWATRSRSAAPQAAHRPVVLSRASWVPQRPHRALRTCVMTGTPLENRSVYVTGVDRRISVSRLYMIRHLIGIRPTHDPDTEFKVCGNRSASGLPHGTGTGAGPAVDNGTSPYRPRRQHEPPF